MILKHNKLLLLLTIFSCAFLYPCIETDPLFLTKCTVSGSHSVTTALRSEIDCFITKGYRTKLTPELRKKIEECSRLGEILKLDPISKKMAKEFVLICYANNTLGNLVHLMEIDIDPAIKKIRKHVVGSHSTRDGLLAPIAFLLEPYKDFVEQMFNELELPGKREDVVWRWIKQNWDINIKNPELFLQIHPAQIAKFLSFKMYYIYGDTENEGRLPDYLCKHLETALTVCPNQKYRREMVSEFLRLVGSEFDTLYPDLSEKLKEFIDTYCQKIQIHTLTLAKCLAMMSTSVSEALKEEIEFCLTQTSWRVKLSPKLRETLKKCVNFGDLLELDPINEKTAKELVFICFCNHTLPYLAFLLDFPGHDADLQFDSNTLLMAPIAFLLEPHKDLVEPMIKFI